ncbi:MAG: NAD(P)-dependent oxidoreductase [Cyclobacteriaceae bacterium]
MKTIKLIGASSFLGHSILKSSNSFLVETINKNEYRYPIIPIESIVPNLLDSDIIILCSAAAVQPNNRSIDSMIFGLNTFEPLRLIHLLSKHRYSGQLVTFGSYFSLGKNNLNQPVDESYTLGHTNDQPNSYCQSKHWLTRLSSINRKNGFDHLHLVLTNIYGPGENENRLFPYLKKSLAQNEIPKVTSGEQYRQFTFVDDVAHFILNILKTSTSDGVYHFSNPDVIQVKDAIQRFYNTYNQTKKTHHNPEFGSIPSNRDSSMDYLALDCSKAFSSFGKPKFTSLTEGLKLYL